MILGNKIIITSLLIVFTSFYTQAGGISVDAGLTPGQDRWILRTQYRFMERQNSTISMRTQMVPLMIAYGLTSNYTIMARVTYVNRIIYLNNAIYANGFNDPTVLLKVKIYRKNTANYVLGIAPYFASNIPVGNTEISSRTWNPELGLSMSFRPRFLSIDFTGSFTFIDAVNKTENRESNNLSINIAFSSIIPIDNYNTAISPVLESTFNKEFNSHGNKNSGPEVLFLSPGIMFIKSSLILETLYQIPVYQQTNSQEMESKSRFIAGLRYMF